MENMSSSAYDPQSENRTYYVNSYDLADNLSELLALNDSMVTVVPVRGGISASVKNHTVMTSCLMFASGVIGNLLALFVLLTSGPDQRKTLFYKLVAGLAITDLLGTVATSPVVIAVYLNDFRWLGGTPMCHYFSFFMIYACFASMLIVCAMAVERYICVRHPYTYHTKVSGTKFATFTLMTCWVVAGVMATLPVIGVGRNIKQYPYTWCFFDFLSKDTADVVFNSVFVVIALLCIIITFVCNVSVIYTLITLRSRQSGLAERMTSFSSTSSFSSSSTSSSLRRRKRATTRRFGEVQMMLMLMGVTIIFTACFAPLTIFVLVCQTPVEMDTRRWLLSLVRMASFNPILDPWVYILCRRELAWRVVKLIRWILRLPPLLPPGFTQQQLDLLCPDVMSGPSVSPNRKSSLMIGEDAMGYRRGGRASVELNGRRTSSGLGFRYDSGFKVGGGGGGKEGLLNGRGNGRGSVVVGVAKRSISVDSAFGSDWSAEERERERLVGGSQRRSVDSAVCSFNSVIAGARGGGGGGGESAIMNGRTKRQMSLDVETNGPRPTSPGGIIKTRDDSDNRRRSSVVSFCLQNQNQSPLPPSNQRRCSNLDNLHEHPEEELLQPQNDSSLEPDKNCQDTGDEISRRMSWSDPYNPSSLAFCYQCLCLPPAPRGFGSLAYHSSGREMSSRRFSSNAQRPMSIVSFSDARRGSQLR